MQLRARVGEEARAVVGDAAAPRDVELVRVRVRVRVGARVRARVGVRVRLGARVRVRVRTFLAKMWNLRQLLMLPALGQGLG